MPVQRRLTTYARQMRKTPTGPEKALWQRLRSGQLHGLRFRRQQPLGSFIADFYCSELKLVIELDGAGHESQVAYDTRRKAWLESQGFTVLRIGSDFLFSDPDDVFLFIAETCKRLLTEKNPPPGRLAETGGETPCNLSRPAQTPKATTHGTC